mgnify:CR=1 FL=1
MNVNAADAVNPAAAPTGPAKQAPIPAAIKFCDISIPNLYEIQ